MKTIAFVDTEIEPGSGRVADIGSVREDGRSFHSSSIADFNAFLKGAQYVCGHNIWMHDLKYIRHALQAAGIDSSQVIDTLHLSPLLFPTRPYHALVKDDKLQTEKMNNPLNDSIKAKGLFFDEVAAFRRTHPTLQRIYAALLIDRQPFSAFFRYLDCTVPDRFDLEAAIRRSFRSQICGQADLPAMAEQQPVELAYALALINTRSRYSITPPWVLHQFPAVQRILFLLRSNPCLTGCDYCNEALDSRKGLKRFFGFDSYRTYAGEPLQERAVNAALANKSLLAVFPTGGGKSITFQVPALMSGYHTRGLTVIISPLQSLMKDQVDNLERAGITDAVTVNGLLDPIERAKSLERVENGSASLLYIAPESLRSRTIERLLLGRNVVRFVIDEAHCFSSWGQDFRVDYLYIGDFIKSLQEKKNLQEDIPVSCFTATAKQKVIEDIRDYFREKLSIEMELFSSGASRTNLHYQVFEMANEEDKYNALRDLIEHKSCPTIIYVSRTRKAYMLADRLTRDGYPAKPYHGKMDKQEKSHNQDAFIRGEVPIMVATSAFGMGVDKKDVGMVIHYEISDSLENYVQEAGRAGRDENISADCYVLFNDEDLSKHFILLNQTKLSIQDIQQVWKAVKDLTRYRSKVSQSALEIARKAGWDDGVLDIQTRVTTAIAALEEAGYLKRGQNMPRVYANSILTKTAAEAIARIYRSPKFDDRQKVNATRIIKKLFSSKSRKHLNDEAAEARVDYISDHLAIPKEEVIRIINLLRESRILADTKDLTAFIKKKENVNRSLGILKEYMQLERFLLGIVNEEERVFSIKELNEQAEFHGCKGATPNKLKTVLTIWAIKNWIKRRNEDFARSHIAVQCMQEKEWLEVRLAKRHEQAQFILEYLYEKNQADAAEEEKGKEEALVEFSVLELKEAFQNRLSLFQAEASMEEIEDALFYLSRIEALKIEGGFMVVYNALAIERMEMDNKKRYKVEDYQKLNQFYENKVQQVHIVGEYARQMIADYKSALQFVDDYFRLNYTSFLNKYFKGSRQHEIRRNITPAKFKQLFGELSPTQLKIINDNVSKYMVVAAGPGSGKTRILVHKLASLLLMEDIKHEQLLMLTFSRAAATEFKKRLLQLIGNAANYVEIKTFHSYCFDLLGRVGTLEKSGDIIQETLRRIRSGEVEAARVTKSVLVIDEAQDMDADEFELISALMELNEEMRVIAVGDDDQNIFEFRGASAQYMKALMEDKQAVMYELVDNYRSKRNLVDYANQWVKRIPNRLKQTPNVAVQSDDGRIKVVRYRSSHLIDPLVRDILSEGLAGTACVLTKTNDEALHLAGLLVKQGMPAKLIQSNDGFSLHNLIEVRYWINQFHLDEGIYMIPDEAWAAAKRNVTDKFRSSANLELCLNLIRDFEAANPKYKYRSDLELFIRESRLEDFFGTDAGTVVVSTIHKAKGREFERVFLLLDQFSVGTEEALRLLYVAMTRAKRDLTIHYNGTYLDPIKTDHLRTVHDDRAYSPPAQLALQLTYRDVWLDFFLSCQLPVARLNSGDMLKVDGDGCSNDRGETVVRFSRQLMSTLESFQHRGYKPTAAKIRFIVYWQKENTDYEVRVVLPELVLERVGERM